MSVPVTTINEAPQPDPRVRKTTPVYVGFALIALTLVLVVAFALVKPLVNSIGASNESRVQAEQDAEDLREYRAVLEDQRDNIIASYDAINLFVEQYPNSPEQDTLFRDIENSSIFATVVVDSIATKYPEILDEGLFEGGSVITPDLIVIGGGDEDEEPTKRERRKDRDSKSDRVGDEENESDVNALDDDVYPLGTVPLSLSGTLDSSYAFVDNIGTTMVASPYLGYFTYGGETERPRLSMAVVAESTTDELNATYFTDPADAGTAGWSTVFSPDTTIPPYRDVENLDALTASELVSLFPLATAPNSVVAPQEWVDNNGYLPLSDISRSAWLIDEIHNSPGRAILIRFVSSSGSSIAITGQQFIIRELPPLPESIFGDLDGDGVINDEVVTEGDPVDGPTPSPSPSPTDAN